MSVNKTPKKKVSKPDKNITKTQKTIREIRLGRGKKQFEHHAEVGAEMVKEAKRRGALLHDGRESYLFLNDVKQLIRLELGWPECQDFLSGYGLFPTEQITRQTVDMLEYEARTNGILTTVYPFTCYDRDSNTIYLSDFDAGIYKITSTAVMHVPNGTDRVMFIKDSRWTPLKLDLTNESGANWIDSLINGMKFAQTDWLDVEDQQILICLWTLSLFMPQLFPSKMILTIIGEPGSFKTSLLRRIGQLIFGPGFNVTPLSRKEDDFVAAVTTDPLFVIDNADTAPSWLEDKLAVAATGGTYKKRELFTTNTRVEFPVCASLGITCRTPNFRREDVSQRLLPIHVERTGRFRPQSDIERECANQRDSIMLGVVYELSAVLKGFEETKDWPYTSSFRMADFASFAWRLAPMIKSRAEIEELLERLEKQQQAFTSEDNTLMDLIETWLEEPSNDRRWVLSSELERELRQIAQGRIGLAGLPWTPGDTQGFSMLLISNKATLTGLFGMKKKSAGSNRKAWSFTRTLMSLTDPNTQDEADFIGVS